MKAFLYNPPGPRFQRGEDRCGADVDGSATVTLRPPNDLGYLGAILRDRGWRVLIRDYPARGGSTQDFLEEVEKFSPDLVVLSATVGTLEYDMRSLDRLRAKCPAAFLAAKGPPFSIYPAEFFTGPGFSGLDAGLLGEAEAVIGDLADCLERGGDVAAVPGILLLRPVPPRRTAPPRLVEDLDGLPWPARDLMENRLYRLPSGRPQATIQVSRGCPCSCIYCLTPLLSGRRLRRRAVSEIIAELRQCLEVHGIRDFFFRADTFTLDGDFVIELCREILAAGLPIRWVANSRSDCLNEERLDWMKKAGCWLVALGLESGSDETLSRARKGTTAADGRTAVALAKRKGLKTLGFFVLGFPWETENDIERTLAYALELDCDFIEAHIACPYPGTELYRQVRKLGLLGEVPPGGDYFSRPPVGTVSLSPQRLLELRRRFLRKYYCRPGYIVRTLGSVRHPRELGEYLRRGLRLLRPLRSPGS